MNKSLKLTLLLVSTLFLPSCASILSGTSQTLTVNTTPEGANCALNRENQVIGRINPTPGSIIVEKTKHDITVECTKAGYLKSSLINESGTAGATAGNIILGGGIGWAVDSARGADNKYQDIVHVNLTKE
ncbi:hypothetical protein N9Z27_02705 [Alphaproteobacteria bacterium]|nr:hypothetical protein [Alphaproteobacteria bacterium]